jgi:hypothetical protein
MTRQYHHPKVRDPATIPFGAIVRINELAAIFRWAPGYINNLKGQGLFPQPEPPDPLSSPNAPNVWLWSQKLVDCLAARRANRKWHDPDFKKGAGRVGPAKKKGPQQGPSEGGAEA